MADGLEILNKDLIEQLLVEDALTLYELEKRGGGGVSQNVWRRVRNGKPVRPSSRAAIATYLEVEPSSLLLLDRKATLVMVGGKLVVVPQQGDGGNDPPHLGPREFRCRGQFRELNALGDDGQVRELTRCIYYGEFENATLTIDGTEAHLIIDDVTMFDDSSCSRERFPSHRLEGHGRYVEGSASIIYTVKDQTGQLLWAGVCVLNVPPTGKIHGYWMSAGQAERGRTVLGTLELERKSLVKSSEEAGDRDQREG
jgi:hypothetical protein